MTKVNKTNAAEVKPSIETKYFYVVMGFFFKNGAVGTAHANAFNYESIVEMAKAKLDSKGWTLIDRFNMHRSAEKVLEYSIKVLSAGNSIFNVYETDAEGAASFVEYCDNVGAEDPAKIIEWYENHGAYENEPVAA